jgi:hypothetical protein
VQGKCIFAVILSKQGHYTPEHGSWLNIAGIDLSVPSKQGLNRRINNLDLLNTELTAWESSRYSAQLGVDWQFTTVDARIKLKRLYPQLRVDRLL